MSLVDTLHQIGITPSATALCFVAAARTNTGTRGTAIKVKAGYVATTDLPDAPPDRRMTFDLGESALGDRLPACAAGST